ncbi:MAG: DoxX family membrane protein [Bosea sp.]|nr:DoxX family membrane protein [Bosea sp. (in: a-proteobacteria)]
MAETSFLALAGRILMGLLFVVIGIRLLMARRPVAGLLATKKIPLPLFVAVSGGAIEIALGAAAIAGFAPRVTFLAMALFVIAATAMVHDFWTLSGQARAQEINHVLVHGLVVGGLLVMAAYPW